MGTRLRRTRLLKIVLGAAIVAATCMIFMSLIFFGKLLSGNRVGYGAMTALLIGLTGSWAQNGE